MRKSRWLAVFLALSMLMSAISGGLAAAAPQANLPNYQPIDLDGARLNDIQLPKTELDRLADLVSGDGADATGGDVGTQGVPPTPGEVKLFLGLDDYNGVYYFKYYTLMAINDEVEVWAANNLNFPDGDPRNPVVVTAEQAQYLADEFAMNALPKEIAFFGQFDEHTGENSLLAAWGLVAPDEYVSPDGVDRIMVMVDNVRDESYYDPEYPNYIAGFYSPTFEAYFDRNMVTLDAYNWANRLGPNDSPWRNDDPENDREYLYDAVLAHEFQHLIHDDFDSDEDSWINEGMSDFAEYLVGYDVPDESSHINFFLEYPYNSLVAWGDQGGREILADYGFAYLFILYLNDHFGQEFIRDLASEPGNGMEGVEAALAAYGSDLSFGDLYRDFITAVALNVPIRGKQALDPYAFSSWNRTIDFAAVDPEEATGPQAPAWGTAFNVIDMTEAPIRDFRMNGISFLETPWQVIDDPLASGHGAVLWGGAGDLVDNFLVFQADLTGSTNPNLTFDTYYEIEYAWDYGFVQVSTDGGETWNSLSNANTQSVLDPSGHPNIGANLPGFTGSSGGWVTESFDLSALAGQEVLVAFRNMTDWAFNEAGWYIDNVAVDGSLISDGSSVGEDSPFSSIQQIREEYSEYMVTFVGHKNGAKNYKVLQLDLVTFESADAKELKKFLRDSSLDYIVYMVTFAAPTGTMQSVDYGFDVEFVERGPKNSKK